MNKAMQKVEVFTDGGCHGNPGPGGWGVLLRYGKTEKTLSGFNAYTTNNQMELTAAIEGLAALKCPCEVVMTTDSQYVKNGITKWIKNWLKNNWKTKAGPVKNKALWEKLNALTHKHTVEWRWVRGHTGHRENEICDMLATAAIEQGKKQC